MSNEAPTLLIRDSELAELASRILCGVASVHELERAKLEDVRAIKSDTGAIHYRAHLGGLVKAGGKADGRTRRYIASAESPDRMGDVISVAGWRFGNFAKNPVAHWGHDTSAHPIGTVSDWTKGRVGDLKVLKESITYFGADVNPLSEATMRVVDAMAEAGVQPAVSVGFLPIKAHMPDEEERKARGMPSYGVLFLEQDQLELSNVSVPAHPDALLVKAIDGLVSAGKVARSVADELLAQSGSWRQRVYSLGGIEREAPDEPAEEPERKEPDQIAELAAKVAALEAETAKLRADLASVYGSCAALQEQADSGRKVVADIVRRLDRPEQPGESAGLDERRIVQPPAGDSADFIGQVLERLASNLS
ncbi:MAG TPA: hypothetical protein PKW35_00680 [Nannocystaceae bacterium]|nr:hypothetical protein [Nannocystaceae bacterium]